MLRILIKKEIIETILDLRFVIVTLLCTVLIPLGMYVSRKDYEQRLAEYQREHQMYRQHYASKVHADVEAQGFRPPSVLSIFASGLAPFVPDKAITSRSGLFRAAKSLSAEIPQSLLFGKADLLFNVSFVVSLAALIFTFNSISGEKETGTLCMMISNSIPRGQILLAKIVGSYITLLIPFIISLLIALIILDASPDVSILSSRLYSSLVVILLITLLFILAMVGLGILVSTLTRSSMTSIVMLFLVWAIFVLAVPKVSPMIAEVIYPIESPNVIHLRKRITIEDIEKEFDQKKRELFDQCQTAFGVSSTVLSWPPQGAAAEQAYAKYDREVTFLNEECQKRTAYEVRKIEQDYRSKRNIQASIAMNLSRISPVCCYTYLVSGLSGTGVAEADKFIENAQRYQDEVKKAIYDNIITKAYGGKSGGTAATTVYVPGFDRKSASIPDMRYQYTSLAGALESGWVDILLLFVFNFLFFVAAFVSFLKYDVR